MFRSIWDKNMCFCRQPAHGLSHTCYEAASATFVSGTALWFKELSKLSFSKMYHTKTSRNGCLFSATVWKIQQMFWHFVALKTSDRVLIHSGHVCFRAFIPNSCLFQFDPFSSLVTTSVFCGSLAVSDSTKHSIFVEIFSGERKRKPDPHLHNTRHVHSFQISFFLQTQRALFQAQQMFCSMLKELF